MLRRQYVCLAQRAWCRNGGRTWLAPFGNVATSDASLAVSQDGQTLMIASPIGGQTGMWASYDAGLSWRKEVDTVSGLAVGGIAIRAGSAMVPAANLTSTKSVTYAAAPLNESVQGNVRFAILAHAALGSNGNVIWFNNASGAADAWQQIVIPTAATNTQWHSVHMSPNRQTFLCFAYSDAAGNGMYLHYSLDGGRTVRAAGHSRAGSRGHEPACAERDDATCMFQRACACMHGMCHRQGAWGCGGVRLHGNAMLGYSMHAPNHLTENYH